MRVKQIWERLPVPAKLRLFWDRITFSRITAFYFVFSVIHCFVQVAFQVQAFTVNAQAANFLFSIIEQGNAVDPGFSVIVSDGVRFCNTVPQSLSPASCPLVWDGVPANDTMMLGAVAAAADLSSASSVASSSSVPSSSVVTIPTSTIEATSSIPTSTANAISSLAANSTSTATSSALSLSATPTPQVTTTVTEFIVLTSSSVPPTQKATQSKSAADATSTQTSGDDVVAKDHDGDDRKNGNSKRGTDIMAMQSNGSTVVTINGLGWNNTKMLLDQSCLLALNWPVETLENTKREDITFIAFQFWVLGMSIVALLNESMPHVIASLLTHVMATAWGGFQIFHTEDFHADFSRLATKGACKPVNLLPTYWTQRGEMEFPSLALNAFALLVSAFLSWRLIKLFGWQTFKRVGASRTINRVYVLVLCLSIAIQLSLFFIVAAASLWVDQLFNGNIGRMAVRGMLYKGIMITVLLLLLPWLAMGWLSVRRELKVPMAIFLVMSVLYLAGWGAMFASDTFRWTFVTWTFYSLIASASAILALITLVLGVMCRMNFGKGLSRYLNAQEPLDGDDFIPESSEFKYDSDPEKVEFPSMSRQVPTFSAAFGSGEDVPPPSQMNFGPPRLGPRFTNPPAEPFESQPAQHFRSHSTASTASTASSRSLGSTTVNSDAQLSRQDTASSNRSYGSYRSDDSGHVSEGTDRTRRADRSGPRSKPWVIE